MHKSVLLKESEEIAKNFIGKKVCDVTFGAGGHSRLFLKSDLLCLDRDQSVMQYKINDIPLIIDKFSNLDKYLNGKYDLLFADLGISWMHIKSDRGFSFMTNSDLDMRMGCSEISLREIINKISENEIYSIIRDYGQERFARKIAHNIILFRLKKDILTTFDLRDAIGYDDFSIFARVFQAFRIYINDEINEINKLLGIAKDNFKSCAIITFHSIEHNLVKRFLKKYANNIKEHIPSIEEISINPASRSAKLLYCDFCDYNILD